MNIISMLLFRFWSSIIILAGVLILVPTAQGETLFDNGPIGPPNPATLYNMTATCCTVYDNFILNSHATVTGFTWSGFEDPGLNPDSTVTSTSFNIVAGADPQSGNLVTSGIVVASRVANGQTVPGHSTLVGYDYGVTGLSISLSAGTTYWLGLSNTLSPTGSSSMASTDMSPLGGGVWQDFFGSFFHYPDGEMVFTIEGTIIPVEHFSCVGFEAPLSDPLIPVSIRKPNRALPFKAELVDEDGNPVTDSTISAPPVVQVTYTPGMGGEPTDISDDTVGVGLGTVGNQFVFTDDEKWQYNLKLGKNSTFSAPGTYKVTMATGDSYVIIPTCEAYFVIE
jgi:hypothetical protein